ncbi:AsmA-like C-terminal region-containing protein [Mongoliitalea daihaiensis]|uniref:AsmA-like C-terminal region-containing protein n=1 Tax=Mongoliitalea daihaiensis TaxID=2782006 RepID=UPI001F2F7A92|nr:AsmA-like C-terminal region-containing protein [Mongoliitalea daihaiensis]UJP66601.1 membrane biogenesis protein [Mongoliitalea daihaiensis]
MRKRILKAFFILPLLILTIFVVGIALVYTKQDILVQRAITLMNEQFEGKLVLEDSHISVFTNFPYISIDLKGLKFYGDREKSALPIYEFEDLYVGFSVSDILSGNYKVKAIKVLSGHIRLVEDAEGRLNLLQAKNLPSSDTESSDAIDFELKKLWIENLQVSFYKTGKDELISVELMEVKTALKSKKEVLDVLLEASLHLAMEKDGKEAFFSDKNLTLNLDFILNQSSKQITFKPSKLKLQESLLRVGGVAAFLEEGLHLDLELEGEKPDFNLIAAFLPKETAEAFKRYQNQGEVFFRGSIRGLVAQGNSPAVAFEFGCDNAFFENTALERRVEDLRFLAFFTNGLDRNLRTSEFRLQNFNAKPERGVFQGNLTVRDFENPYVKVDLLADLDLAFIGEFFQIPDLKGVSGEVLLRMDFDELMDLNLSNASIRQAKESLQSELRIRNLNLTYADFPYPIRDLNVYAKMVNGAFSLDSFSLKLADSDFSMKAQVSDLPAIFHQLDVPVKVNLQANAGLIELGKFLYKQDKDQSEELRKLTLDFELQANAVDLFKFDYLPKGRMQLKTLDVGLKNYPHDFKKFRGVFEIDSQMVAIRSFQGKIDTSDIYLTGKLENYPKWFKSEDHGVSNLKVRFASDYLKIKDLMTYQGVNFLPDAYKEEYFTDLRLDADLRMDKRVGKQNFYLTIAQLQGQTKIHPLKFEAFGGKMSWSDQYLKVDNFGGTMGESSFRVSMGYNLGDSVNKSSIDRPDFLQLRGQKLDLDALMGFESIEKESSHEEAFNIFKLPFRDFKVGVEVDKLLYHGTWLDNIKARLRSSSDSMLYIEQLDFALADGKFGMRGYLNGRNPDKIYFHSTIRVDQIQVDQLLFKMDNMGKDIVLADNLRGKVSGSIESKLLVYPDLTPILDQSEAKINVKIYNGELIDFAPMRAMGSFFADRNMNRIRFDTLQNSFELNGGVMTIPSMQINSSLGFMELSGSQGLDMKMDYLVRVPWSLVTQVGARALFGGRNRDEVDPDQEDAIISRSADRRVRFLNIRMSGTPDDLDVGLARNRRER